MHKNEFETELMIQVF